MSLSASSPFTPKILILTHQQQTAFENIAGKGEIARYEQFLLFPQCFLLNQIIVSPFFHVIDIISLLAAELEEPKIAIWGKGLTKRLACIISLSLFQIKTRYHEKGNPTTHTCGADNYQHMLDTGVVPLSLLEFSQKATAPENRHLYIVLLSWYWFCVYPLPDNANFRLFQFNSK